MKGFLSIFNESVKVEILDEWKRNFKVANKMSCAAAF